MAISNSTFALEDAVVLALVTAFNADSYLGNIAYGPRENEAEPKERIDVACTGFVKASEQQVYASGRYWDSHFRGDIAITVINQRPVSAARSAHGPRVGRIRYLMTPYAQILTSSNLPAYEILSIEQTGSTSNTNEPDDTDRTELTFTIELALLASALA